MIVARSDIRTTPVELHVDVLAELVAWAGLGELHIALQPEPVWRSPQERADFSRAAGVALANAGVLHGPAVIDPDFQDLLPLLTQPATECYGWFSVAEETRSVLAAAGSMDALLAVRVGDAVRLSTIRRDGLVAALVAALPPAAPARGETLLVRGTEIAALNEPTGASEREVPAHVTEMLRIAKLPVLGSGELYTASRDTLGRHTTRGPVRYMDTERGRYLNLVSGAGDALELVLAPGTPDALVAALNRAENHQQPAL